MIVYWAPWTHPHLSYIEHPSVNRLTKSAFKGMKGLTNLGESYHRCPAVQDYFENIFELKSPVDFEIVRNPEGGFYTEYYDQEFWNNFVLVRNENLLSFNIFYLFIPETDLTIEITSPYFTDNDFANKTMIVPGKFNAYRWLRPIQCTFAIKSNVDRIKINAGDTLIYLRMLTNENIKLKKFFMTEPVVKIIDQNLQIKDRNFTRYVRPYSPMKMIKLYEMFESSKIRKLIMKEVKNNTLE